MENPIKMDDLGIPLFLETPTWTLNGWFQDFTHPNKNKNPTNNTIDILKHIVELLHLRKLTAQNDAIFESKYSLAITFRIYVRFWGV